MLTGRTRDPERLAAGLRRLGWRVRDEGGRVIAVSPAGQQVEIRDSGELRITGRGEDSAARTLVKLARKLGVEVEVESLESGPRRPLVYGPVPSRRLGRSLGIDLPRGVCTQDCEYCSVGVPRRASPRERFEVDPVPLARELRAALSECRPDAVTLAGVGEPTLCANLGEVVEEITPLVERAGAELVLLTNSTWVSECPPEVDRIIASLDCAREGLYRRINRPHPDLSLDHLVRQLERVSEDVTVEVLLCRVGRVTNAEAGHVRELAGLLSGIGVREVQLNTVSRPPARGRAEAVGAGELARAERIFRDEGFRVEVYR